jgi:GTP-binding protein HflX
VKGRNPELSRLGGGRGGSGGGARRGSGEQQLEYDRRVIRERIDTINRKLKREKTGREVRGARLREGPTPTVALVGYTNAGKTTILNALSGAGRSTKDRLFETLETTTRVVEGAATANGAEGAHPDFVVTDTVGFIRKLPTQLVHSFASTLEAANHADVRVLCADASSPELEDEIATVGRTLADGAEDGTDELPTILCLNKMDLVPEGRAKEIQRLYPEGVGISAISDAGPLLQAIYAAISSDRERMEVLIPHATTRLRAASTASRTFTRAEPRTRASSWTSASRTPPSPNTPPTKFPDPSPQ